MHGSTGTGRITADNPRDGFAGDLAGLYAHPTIVDGVRREDALYRTETFGPIVGVATFRTFDEAVELANGHGYGLSAAIYTTDPAHAFRFRERVSAGMVSVNNSTSGAEAHLPFGGNGRSGQRLAAVRRVGARPVHPLAEPQLGLRGPAAEGADGHPRPARGPGLPPGLTGCRPPPGPLCGRRRRCGRQPPKARDRVAAMMLGRRVRRSSSSASVMSRSPALTSSHRSGLGLPAA